MHLWAERFYRERGDLFQTQDEIVSYLARKLDGELIEAEARRVEQPRISGNWVPAPQFQPNSRKASHGSRVKHGCRR
jgi:hypothetical protein